MKMLKLSPILMFLFMIFILTGNLTAMGASEGSHAYESALKQVFDELIDGIYNSETQAVSAKIKLHDLRDKYDISYTDEAGILDAIIDRAQEQSLTRDEAQFFFQLLQEGKLMEYRKEASRKRSELHHRELLSLLRQKLESSSSQEGSVSGLLPILNNYYNFVGLEYDKEYSSLSSLIISLENGSITAGDMMSNLSSMDQQLSNNSNRENTPGSNERINQINAQQSIENGSQQGSEGGASQPTEGPHSSGAGEQKPQGGGMNANSRK
ncbi:MAG: hypothetical protein JEZ04_09720 [Spirochaetales bacterium]|nr:hypothetical protein [Spirochaetales bacterium]